jgi:hypothetical protein
MADDDDEWRFSVEEVGADDEGDERERSAGERVEGGEATAEDGVTYVGTEDDGPTVGIAADERDGESEGNVAGELVPEAPVEPGRPSLENVVFTTIGAILTALIFAGVLDRLDPTTTAAITAAIVGGAGLLYVFFTRVGVGEE